MGIRLIAPPSDPPLTLAELKGGLRVDHDLDDALLTRYMAEATTWVETITGKKLMPQTWEYVIDSFPGYEIKLPLRPVQSIVSVKYDDIEGFEQTIPETEYYLDDASEYAWLFPVSA